MALRASALLWVELLAAFALYVMMNYLTNVWNLNITHAAGIINIWNGIKPALVIVLVLAFLVDSFMNDYYMLLLSSIAYTIGLGLLSISTPGVLGPCSEYKEECIGDAQKVLFFTALPLISVGMAGHIVSIMPFVNLQERAENEEKDKSNKNKEVVVYNALPLIAVGMASYVVSSMPYLNIQPEDVNNLGSKLYWKLGGLLVAVVVVIAGGIGLPYINPWSIRFGIPAICTLVATLVFFSGYSLYKPRKLPKGSGSPLTTTLRVFVASARKFSQPLPHPNQLWNEEDATSTTTLRCLDKAAIRLAGQAQSKSWMLCSVREVEDTKIGIRMVPLWLSLIEIGIVLSLGKSYFIEQANRMDRKLGKIKIMVPAFLIFYILAHNISTCFYSILTMCLPRKKYAPPIGIATSMVLAVLCCIAAANVETRRLRVVRDHGLLDKPNESVPMSVFWLLPQFLLLAAVDGIANKSITGFFTHHAPESMRKYLTDFAKAVLGLGTMASVLCVYIVGKVSEGNQKPNWFQPSLNESRLDRYYWTLSALSAANLVIYVMVAFFYKY